MQNMKMKMDVHSMRAQFSVAGELVSRDLVQTAEGHIGMQWSRASAVTDSVTKKHRAAVCARMARYFPLAGRKGRADQ
jgi:hypothetical protein